MTYDYNAFAEYEAYSGEVIMANGHVEPVRGRGTVAIRQDGRVLRLADVLHVPGLSASLVSLMALMNKGLATNLTPDAAYIIGAGPAIRVPRTGESYTLG